MKNILFSILLLLAYWPLSAQQIETTKTLFGLRYEMAGEKLSKAKLEKILINYSLSKPTAESARRYRRTSLVFGASSLGLLGSQVIVNNTGGEASPYLVLSGAILGAVAMALDLRADQKRSIAVEAYNSFLPRRQNDRFSRLQLQLSGQGLALQFQF